MYSQIGVHLAGPRPALSRRGGDRSRRRRGAQRFRPALRADAAHGDSRRHRCTVRSEYIWQDRDPPFRGVAVIEAADVEALNAFALHYGPTLRMAIHAATDVQSDRSTSGRTATRPFAAWR